MDAKVKVIGGNIEYNNNGEDSGTVRRGGTRSHRMLP